MDQNPDRRARILLINPNSLGATTALMVAIARSAAVAGFDIVGATATRAPQMIVSAEALEAAAAEVEEIARTHRASPDGIIVAAFGDPGLAGIRAAMKLPAVGIGESSMLEAAAGGRRFGVATTTPLLKSKIEALPDALGLRSRYTGTRFAEGDPQELMRDPAQLRAALAGAVEACIAQDGAEAVIIGGGPLGEAARELQPIFTVPVIAPIPSAVRRIIRLVTA
ncbi:aspartate/glutamate racemase family protein [Bradyrhizobium diazoefficiens]|jgi:allantoin racemase|uniref:Putative hydantoin racemase n=1 Tax=Bradyrhizobium diazoefficiens SEMIA 5080 TaxID=754504 RepID=A0A837C3V2_9BRAD|nr:aspartate/glutamate racemase family protein [Bradyrhizobium diazoefficiens]APO56249.1 hydantoin racemase [Bradyrhizobium diazoefficiens]KGJ63665.1 putative hydantoin racemase [Bradyrhizobium diazoefficiens SEMIA 5080]KOY05733.1 hydantoin racemase [Bradyrhizobium diazoefficiens]MCD9291652.1 aspartate/glutamate racemase family protein [Bradyrhizobium diazoefficiens]MCD9809444.1 aspartate/glutamate racemase family protein [Bradyrhizobium diazoefficiens]